MHVCMYVLSISSNYATHTVTSTVSTDSYATLSSHTLSILSYHAPYIVMSSTVSMNSASQSSSTSFLFLSHNTVNSNSSNIGKDDKYIVKSYINTNIETTI